MSFANHSFAGSYLVHLQGKVLGPLKGSHIATLVRNGIYPPDVLVQRPGEEEVVPFNEIEPSAAEKPADDEPVTPEPLPRVRKVTMKTVLSPPSVPSSQESVRRVGRSEVPKPALAIPERVPPMPQKSHSHRGHRAEAAKPRGPKWVVPVVILLLGAVVAGVLVMSKQAIHDWWMAGYPDVRLHTVESGPDPADEAVLFETKQPALRPAHPAPASLPPPPVVGMVAVYWQENGNVYFVPKIAAESMQTRIKLLAQRRADRVEALQKLAADVNEARRMKPTEAEPSASAMSAYKLRARRASDAISRERALVKALEDELNAFTVELERVGTKWVR